MSKTLFNVKESITKTEYILLESGDQNLTICVHILTFKRMLCEKRYQLMVEGQTY